MGQVPPDGDHLTPGPRELAALILASGVAVAVVLLSLGAENSSKAISTADAELLSTVLGAAVGALAAFLGGRRRDDP